MENVIVTFTPCGDAANPGIGSFGRTDVDGRYSLTVAGTDRKGALVGKHRMTFVFRDDATFEMTEEELAKGLATGRIRDAGLPPKARDGSMEFVVEPGGTDQAGFDF